MRVEGGKNFLRAFGFLKPWPLLALALFFPAQGFSANCAFSGPTCTPTETMTPTKSPTSTPTQTPTQTPTITLTPTESSTSTPSLTPTKSPTVTLTPTTSPTSTRTSTSTPSMTTTPSSTSTPSLTPTKSPTVTMSPTKSPTVTNTPTITHTETNSPTTTTTPTHTPVAPPTSTSTTTKSPTPSPTPTVTNTPTITNTFTVTPTFTPCSAGAICPCDRPWGATTENLQGGVTCFEAPQLLSASNVFGMSLQNVEGIADYVGTSLGTPIDLVITSDWKLSYFTGELTYGPSQPFPYTVLGAPKTDTTAATSSQGLLVVNGDLTLGAVSGSELPSTWNGVIFCTGNLVVEGGCVISGAVIMGSPYYHGTPGTVSVTGTSGTFGQIIYKPNLVEEVMSQVATYREDISETKKMLGIVFNQ